MQGLPIRPLPRNDPTALGFTGIAGDLLEKSLHQCQRDVLSSAARNWARRWTVSSTETVMFSMVHSSEVFGRGRPQRLGPAAALSFGPYERSATRSCDRRRIPSPWSTLSCPIPPLAPGIYWCGLRRSAGGGRVARAGLGWGRPRRSGGVSGARLRRWRSGLVCRGVEPAGLLQRAAAAPCAWAPPPWVPCRCRCSSESGLTAGQVPGQQSQRQGAQPPEPGQLWLVQAAERITQQV